MANGVGLEAKNVAGAITSMRIDELVSRLAIGIAEGQMALDAASIEMAQFMGDAQIAFGKRPGSEEPDLLSLIELGFTPNFYQFVDTILEVRVAVSSQFEETREYDVSQVSTHEDEFQAQSEYEAQRSSSRSVSGGSYRAGRGRRSYGATSSRYAYSGVSSSRYAGASSYKLKNVSVTTVDANYASKYNYAVEASSLIKTKLVPVPPPEVFEETIRARVQQWREQEELMRLTGQVRAILPELTREATTLVEGIEGLEASELSEDVLALQQGYGRLQSRHWALIEGSVQYREAADRAISDAVNKAEELLEPAAGVIPAELQVEIRSQLEKFKQALVDVEGKLPSTEEE